MTKPEIKELLNYKLLSKILKKYPKSKSEATRIKGFRDYTMGYGIEVMNVNAPCIFIYWVSQGFESCASYREIPIATKQQLIDELLSNGFILEINDNLTVNINGFNSKQSVNTVAV